MTSMASLLHLRPVHGSRLAATLTATALALAGLQFAAGPAAADPKPGSTGSAGPKVPVTAPRAVTTKKPVIKSSAKSSAAKSSAAKSASKAKTATASGFGQGSKGEKVLEVQTLLQNLKYDISEAEGSFGDQTHHAVMAFQKVNGLARTGRVTDATLAAMRVAVEPAPLLPTGGADRIEVDIEKQYLGLYKGGTLYKLLSVSTGSGKDFCVLDPETNKTDCDTAVTPGGSYRIRSRIIGWRESKLGLLYNPLYFNGGIAIHGAPSVPAGPASHGCVRIPMISSEWFPDAVANGMPVYVFGGENRPAPLNAKAPTDTTLPPGAAVPTTVPLAALPGSTLPAGTPTTVAGAPAPTTVPGATTIPGTPSVAPTTTIVVTLPTTLGPGVTNPPATAAPTTVAPTTVPGGVRLLPLPA